MSNRPNSSSRSRQAAAAAPADRGSWWIFAVVLVVIVLALGAAVFATRTKNDSTPIGSASGSTVVPNGALSFGDVSITGTPLPEQAEGASTDPAVGQKAPTLVGEQFDGKALTIPKAGEPAVVMFVAHWCPHCQKEVPLLGAYLGEHPPPAGVNLFAVATATSDQKPNFPPGKWLNKEGWPVRTIADDAKNRAETAYGVTGFPFFVVLDANGKVITRTSGELSTEQFQHLIDVAAQSQGTGAGTAVPATSAPRP